jgi:hypothetical protein
MEKEWEDPKGWMINRIQMLYNTGSQLSITGEEKLKDKKDPRAFKAEKITTQGFTRTAIKTLQMPV